MIYHLTKFANDAEYQNFINSSEFVRPNVSYIETPKQVIYNSTRKSPFYNAKAGDIVLYDKVNKTKVAVAQKVLNITDYPLSRFTPIGVIVIPAKHNVYGTGECGIVSINAMSYKHPDTGYYNKTMHYGGFEVDNPNLANYTDLPLISTALTSNTIINNLNDAAYLPSTKFTEIKPIAGNGLDTESGYYSGEYAVTFNTVPSPYLENGKRNPSYPTKSFDSNALSDFNGRTNTQAILTLATAQSDWKTANTIVNSYEAGYYPVACCCWRYSTEGTSQGDWYLPAVGELGYLVARFNEVQNGIKTIQNIYDMGYILKEDKSMWSSTERDALAVRYIDMEDGRTGKTNKTQGLHTRAFLRA